MLVALSFHEKDKHQAAMLANWILQLGGVKNHTCLLIVPSNVTSFREVLEPLLQAFHHVEITVPTFNPEGWPQGPNAMFDHCCRRVENIFKVPFLWIEPDAIPLKSSWVDDIEKEYVTCQKPFMGDFVESRKFDVNAVDHMSGVAVYPCNISREAPTVLNNYRVAWDIVGAEIIVPKMHITKLIQHSWKPASFVSLQSLELLSSDAVIFHQSKDGELIKRLQEVKAGAAPPPYRGKVAENFDKPIVQTFYDPLSYLADEKLLEMWIDNWKHFGWSPKIVNLQTAREMDPERYKRYEESANLYGGGCKRDYLFRCYARWLTMLNGGFMVDFDVFNFGFTPFMLDAIVSVATKNKVIHLSGDSTPCATHGSSLAYQRYVNCFDSFDTSPSLTTNSLKENIHDLNIIDANPNVFVKAKMCSLFPKDTSWDKYPLVHYTHGFVQYPRSSKINLFRRIPGL